MNGLERPFDFRRTIASVVVVLLSGCGPNVERFAETAYETRDTNSVDSLLKDFRVGSENLTMVADSRKQRRKRRFNSDESLNEEKLVGGGFLPVHFGYHLHDFRSRFSNSSSLDPPPPTQPFFRGPCQPYFRAEKRRG